ncbi:hypothetical protein NUS63_06290, partial [Glaesserella parasuis]|nr:hypothetical protein [Glaesserella parasuis]
GVVLDGIYYCPHHPEGIGNYKKACDCRKPKAGYDGVHRISFLVDEYGKIMSVFNKFKTKEHHQLVINFLKGNSDGE